MTSVNWDTYLAPTSAFESCRLRCRDAFAGQKNRIEQTYHFFKPKRVVCLGAGYLNDIPVETFIKGRSSLSLVDWIKGVCREAVLKSVVSLRENKPVCLACKGGSESAAYCKNYKRHWLGNKKAEICANFRVASDKLSLCKNFVMGSSLNCIEADVTGEIGSDLAQQATALFSTHHPLKALKKVLQIVSGRAIPKQLPFEDGSVDLVVSSMVASQFYFEPYGYVMKYLLNRLEKDVPQKHKKKMARLANEIENRFFVLMMEGHCEEIRRILKPEGRCYFSTEAFHKKKNDNDFSPVKGYSTMMDIVEKYFDFDNVSCPAITLPDRSAILDGESVVQSRILVKKT